jgi:hypothetical protein
MNPGGKVGDKIMAVRKCTLLNVNQFSRYGIISNDILGSIMR